MFAGYRIAYEMLRTGPRQHSICCRAIQRTARGMNSFPMTDNDHAFRTFVIMSPHYYVSSMTKYLYFSFLDYDLFSPWSWIVNMMNLRVFL